METKLKVGNNTITLDTDTYMWLQKENRKLYIANGRATFYFEGKPCNLACHILNNPGKRRIKYVNGDTLDCRKSNIYYGNRVIKHTSHVSIITSNNDAIMVSLEDANLVLGDKRSWHIAKRGSTSYATADIPGQPKLYMHRLIMKPPNGKVVDHINGNGLDNRRHNLRVVSYNQNSRNRVFAKAGKSGFIGVSSVNGGSVETWRAYTVVEGKQVSIGCWPTAQLAACAYDYYIDGHGLLGTRNFKSKPYVPDEVKNAQLRKPKSKTGHKNIRFKDGAYEAYARIEGKRKYLGRRLALEEAVELQRKHTPTT